MAISPAPILALLEALQRRQTVILLQGCRFRLHLRCLERELFWILFCLDLDETVHWLLCGLRQFRQRLHFLAINLGNRQIRHVVVADRAIGREDLGQNHYTPVPFRVEF